MWGFTYWSIGKAKRVLGYSPRHNFPEFFEALKRKDGSHYPTRTFPGGASNVTGTADPRHHARIANQLLVDYLREKPGWQFIVVPRATLILEGSPQPGSPLQP